MMKYLLIIFFTFSTFANSQIIGVVGNGQFKSKTSGNITPPPTDTTPPTAPSSLVVSNIGETTATLTWNASTDANGISYYRIYNNDVSIVTSTGNNATTYNLTGLTPNTSYTITVRGVDPFSNISTNSNSQTFTTDAASAYASTRFIMMGDSWTYSFYTGHLEAQAVSRIKSKFPDKVVTVHNEGSPGESIDSYAKGDMPNVTGVLAKYSYDPTIDTYCVIMLGVNDARVATYGSLTQTQINNKIANINFMLDAIEAKGFKPVLIEAPFISFEPSTTFPNLFGPAYTNESLGTKPYNDNIIIPAILGRASTAQFAYADGQSFYQPYVMMYNGYPEYESGDGVHPGDAGAGALKQAFVDRLVSYIFTGVVPAKIIKDGETTPITSVNMPGEDDYVNAYYYPLAGSSVSGLQNAIDTYGAVRLGQGNYGQNQGTIYLNSNDKLYGYINTTITPNIVIKQGSTNVLINGVNYCNISIENGASVNNNTIKNTRSVNVIVNNAIFENNTIVNNNGFINWDCSTSGYFRNNKIIKHWPHGGSPQLTFKGNNTTTSYGNLQMWLNHLTSSGDSGIYENLDDVTIIGLDAEGWNLNGISTKAMTYMRDIGNVKLTDLGGSNGYSPVYTPAFDVQANKLTVFNSSIGSSGASDILKSNTSVFSIDNNNNYIKEAGTGYDFKAHDNDNLSYYNNLQINNPLTDPTIINNIKSIMLDTQRSPIDRPNLATIPNPAGVNWMANRVGKPDQTAYIQNLINTNGVAQLPEGIFYIGSTINLKNNQGIIGAGTGKTVIIGLTDDFTLITFSETNVNKVVHLRNITLQGGHTGLKIRPDDYNVQLMVVSQVMQDVVFRNQTYGIHLDKFFGMDNNFFENVNFVSCNIGLYQERNPNQSYDEPGIMYIDKTVFYNCQIIDCGVGFSMVAGRANNLNAWVNCEFDSNDIPVDLFYNNHPVFMNCDFTNNTGAYVVGPQSPSSFYSCNFSGNNNTSTFKMVNMYAEGCNFNDNVPLMAAVGFNPISVYIMNSTVNGLINSDIDHGVFSNSTMNSNPTLNKLLVNLNNGNPTIIINETPTPYPQLLVKH